MCSSDYPAAPEPHPPEGAETSSDPAALPAAEEVIGSEINEGAHDAADAPIPEPAIPFHSLAGIFPPSEASIREQARLIGGDVPIERVILYQDRILDGAALYLACLMIGREPKFETFAGDDPFKFVVGRHLNRGPLSESQRAMAGARAANLQLGDNQYSEGVPIGTASQLLNVSRRSILRARKVLGFGIPELVKAVDDGKITVSVAEHICLFPQLDQRARLRARGLSISFVEAAIRSPSLSTGETSPPQADAAPSEQIDAATSEQVDRPSETNAAGVDTPEVGQAESGAPPTSLENVSGTPSATALESHSGDWILHGYSPVPGVTAVVGSINAPTTLVAAKAAAMSAGPVFWLIAQRGVRTTLRPLFAFADGHWECLRFLEAPTDRFGLPILNLENDLRWLDHEIASLSNVGLAVVDYFSPYLVGEDLEESIRMLRLAFTEIHEIAIKHGIAVVAPCRLPYNGGCAMTKAIDALAAIPELHGLLLVKGKESGTILAKKGLTSGKVSAVDFRTNKSGYFGGSIPPIVLLENGVAPKSAIGERRLRQRRGGRGKRRGRFALQI
jgi:hypothetical protein